MLIRAQTRSEYSHSAIMLKDGSIIESWQGKGVRRKTLADYEGIDFFKVEGVDENVVEEFLLSKIGAKYDYLSVFRFLSKRKPIPSEKWFCSDLVFSALEAGGVKLLNNITPQEVSPALLSLSTLLKKDKGVEWFANKSARPFWLRSL